MRFLPGGFGDDNPRTMKSSATPVPPALPDAEVSVPGGRGVGPRVLLIGYGNELRGDDAAGPTLARRVAEAGWPGVDAMAVPQLLPELAEPIARAGRVLFVDADCGTPRIRWRRLHPAGSHAFTAHLSDPAALLVLAQTLYERCPPAWLIAIPARQCVLGAGLSPLTRRSLAEAFDGVRRVARCFRDSLGRSEGVLDS